MTDTHKLSFHEEVAQQLIEQLRRGTAPWQRPWAAGSVSNELPFNPSTGKRYKGGNAVVLMMQGREDPRWLTYNQAQAIGAQVRKGERGTTCQKWIFSEEQLKRDDAGRPVLGPDGKPEKVTVQLERPVLTFFRVFNAEQIDGLKPLQPRVVADWEPQQRAEAILAASGAKIVHSARAKAYYAPTSDHIHLPHKELFPVASGYYATALHELGHWTGHESRLNRDLGHPFGSEPYAREELRAEISSMLLGRELGTGHDPEQHAAYVSSWIKALEQDPSEIFRAAADAEKMTAFVMSLEQTQQLDNVMTHPEPKPTLDAGRQPSTEEAREALGHPQSAMQQSTSLPVNGERGELSAERTYLAVPYKDKNEARNLGAKWDRSAKSWYVPPGVDAATFSRWTAGVSNHVPTKESELTDRQKPVASELTREDFMELATAKANGAAGSWTVTLLGETIADVTASSEAHAKESAYDVHVARASDQAANPLLDRAEAGSQGKPDAHDAVNEREYLAVPYGERNLARAAGARWDKQAQSWYVGVGADREKLARWALNPQAQEQMPMQDPRSEFRDALASMELDVLGSAEHPIMDGKKHRVRVEGDKGTEKSGLYIGYLEGARPAGFIKNFRTGVDVNWKAKGYSLSEEARAELRAAAAQTLAKREAHLRQQHEEKSAYVTQRLSTARPVVEPTPYLERKGIASPQAGLFTEGNGKHTLIPAYDVTGRIWTMQRVEEDGSKRFLKDARKEGSFHVVGGRDRLNESKVLLLVEGYATGASITAATGTPAVVTFDAGNMLAVAKALREAYPDKAVVVAGDDDRAGELTRGQNRGKEAANQVVKQLGGKAVFPVFAPGEQVDNPKDFTDFNDLATRSKLGPDAVRRQISAVVEEAVRLHKIADGVDDAAQVVSAESLATAQAIQTEKQAIQQEAEQRAVQRPVRSSEQARRLAPRASDVSERLDNREEREAATRGRSDRDEEDRQQTKGRGQRQQRSISR